MKAYVCTIGENTTDLCVSQLKKYGFNVILLDEVEPWINKYHRFLNIADGDCIRIDADVIVNKNIKDIQKYIYSETKMLQFLSFDFYSNDLKCTSPVFYKKEAIDIIKENSDIICDKRPETSASRLPLINPYFSTIDIVVGSHGFYQTEFMMNEAKKNRINRGQMDLYDSDIVEWVKSKILIKTHD